MDKCDNCSYYEETLDAPCYVCTHVGPCPYEKKDEEWTDTILGRLHVPTFKKLYSRYKNIGEIINGTEKD